MPFFLLFVFILFLIFLSRPNWGLYLAVFLAPFLGLVIDFSHFEWTRTIPYLKNLDGPTADFVVMILFAAIFCRSVWPYAPAMKKWSRHILSLVGFWYFFPFLLSGILSLFNVSFDQFNGSLKYLLRPILFFYLMWIVLPVSLIDSEKTLNKVIKIFFWTGLLSALMGLVSLFSNQTIFGFWQRAAPISFGGIAPLGFNHNLLAEVLVATLPLAFYLFARNSGQAKKFFFFSSLLIATIALLTFARAAWLALAAQLLIYYQLSHSGLKITQRLRQWTWPALLIIPLAVYMFLFSMSPIVRSSNSTRLDLTGIAWTYFQQHPWLGNGVGAFVPLIESTRLFTVEYGDPLDAHGVIQKIMAEQGLLGLFAFFIFVSWILRRIFHGWQSAAGENKLLLLCLFMSVAGSLIYQLFNTSYYNAHLWLPIGIALAGVKLYESKN